MMLNRNTDSRFALNPTIDIERSTFNRDCSVKTSFNVGDLIPFYVDEVLPGDTHQIKTSKVVRLQTLITPMMDNLYLDTYYFFVPARLCWEHWKEFQGENTQSAWVPQTTYTVPQITSPATTGWTVGTIADYFGIPTGVAGLSVSAIPFRAYALICDQWFRDENLTDPLNIPLTDATVAGVNTGNYITDTAKGGAPFKVAKYHDYLTSCLPAPLKAAQDVSIGLTGDVPVYGSGNALRWQAAGSNTGVTNGQSWTSATPFALLSNDIPIGTNISPGGTLSGALGVITKSTATSGNFDAGLIADLGAASAITINELRLAFQIQKLFEKDARGGTRYIEILKSHFGVTSPDARLQRTEYLGGNRIPIQINANYQTSATDSTSPQGNPAGYSITADVHGDCIFSSTEHGFIIGVMCARYNHSYQQSLDRFWSRKTRFDFYMPVLANIGEMAVLNKEIYADGSSADDQVFGYQEAWADYRYKPSHVTGEMRSQYATSLDVWHLADDYSTLPTLSDGWIREDKSNVDRVLAVTSAVSNQLFGDIYIENKTTRPMPLFSIPGLVDHH